MKFSFPNSKQEQQEKIVLFVCVENAGRSQMTEGFFNRKCASKGIVQSALERPTTKFTFPNGKSDVADLKCGQAVWLDDSYTHSHCRKH